MKTLKVSTDIIPVGEFKAGISKWLREVQETGHPLVITQNGKPAAVLLSPAEYDALIQSRLFIESVQRGISDIDENNVYDTEELKKELKNRRKPEESP